MPQAMFTVCPKCTLTLEVTANDLRLGQGYVRCGRCSNVFNALLKLTDTAAAPARPAAPRPAAPRPEVSRPEAPPTAAADAAASSARFDAMLDTLGLNLDDEDAEPSPEPSPEAPPEASADAMLPDDADIADHIYIEPESIEPDAETGAALDELLEPAAPTHVPAAPGSRAAARLLEGQADAAERPGPSLDLEVAGLQARGHRRWPWWSAGVGLLVLLGFGALIQWRSTLATAAVIGAPLSRLYAALGIAVAPRWDLGAYEVRQQGAAADPGNPQLIHVRFSLANHARRAQPAPLLRLTLLDRYGKRVAREELTPGDYWPKGRAVEEFLSSDEHIDTDVSVRDPSAASASFELDVCLRTAHGGMRCAGDAGGP